MTSQTFHHFVKSEQTHWVKNPVISGSSPKKSVPEFGINLSEKNLPKLDEFNFEKTIEDLLK